MAAELVALETTVDVSGRASAFDYRETGEDGLTLNREKGGVYGSVISLEAGVGAGQGRIFFEQLQNTVSYRGSTQSGLPLSTDTYNRLTSLGLGFSWQLLPGLGLEGSYAQRRRERHIFATASSDELRESYQWPELSVGLSYSHTFLPKLDGVLAAGYLRAFDGSLEVDLDDQGFGQPVLDLKGGRGYYASAELSYPLARGWKLAAAAAIREWQTARGAEKVVDNGAVKIRIREPASRYALVDFSLGLRHLFR